MKSLAMAAAIMGCVVSTAQAAGGSVALSGGTPAQQAVVQRALDTDKFPWALAGPVTVTITTDPALTNGAGGYATSDGHVYLSAAWLDIGARHTVQHELAHEVDYYSLTDDQRAQLLAYLGGDAWYQPEGGTIAHDSLGSERFAEEMAAVYGNDLDGKDAILWRPALAFDTELVRVGLIPRPLLNHRICKTVRVVKRVKGKRHVTLVRRCHTV